MSCLDIEERIDKILTQYRESPKLLQVIRTALRGVQEAADTICELPSYFNLETAVGDQLTLIGKRLGWPRCHCVCDVQPVFGFDCGSVDNYPIAGFCNDNSTWINCGAFSNSEICIDDDELYRKFLKVRIYGMLAHFDIDSLTEAVQIFWGNRAQVVDVQKGYVVLAPGRLLTDAELDVIKLYPRVMPVAPGIKTYFHLGTMDSPIFGFGEGWGGFCENDEELLTANRIVTNQGDQLIAEDGSYIVTKPMFIAEWMCPVDVRPYAC